MFTITVTHVASTLIITTNKGDDTSKIAPPVVVTAKQTNYEEVSRYVDFLLSKYRPQGAYLEISDDEYESLISRTQMSHRKVAASKVQQLTGLLSYNGEDITYDGKKIHNPIIDHITRLIDSGADNKQWKPLALFLERIQKNPSMRSRTQLYSWIEAHGLTILDDGRFIAYKALTDTSKSYHDGGAYVNGVWVEGQVPQTVGDVVTMERTEVDDDPQSACSYGLHAGSYDYAVSFGNPGGFLALVAIDPADVVSVPVDCGAAKIRTCRYQVIDNKITTAQTYLGKDSYRDLSDYDDDETDDQDSDDDIDWSDEECDDDCCGCDDCQDAYHH